MDLNLQEQAVRVFDYMRKDYPGRWGLDLNAWDWVPGVGVTAIADYGHRTGRQDVLEFVLGWERRNRVKSAGGKVINSIVPYAVYAPLYRHTGDSYYMEASHRLAEWLLNEAPRTRERAFEHTVTENAEFPEQVWADTVFMAVLFLARTARLTGSADYAAEAVQQTLIHLQLLQDRETGVLFHGWNCISANHMSAARWTRANAWIALGLPEILHEIRGLTNIPPELTDRYKRMMEGIVRFQQDDGLWSTVMDRPDFYRETSGSAGIACGIMRGIREGLLDSGLRPAADRAFQAVLGRIAADGEVLGVSGGTAVLATVDAYNAIPCYPTQYGQGLTLMLLNSFLTKIE
ncbi:glycoside hydrolase family 88/105 protein [Paenibacillus sedimenti]|uniref:Glycoside hydrolase family 88 protein n=1 Tax=Paenibacillus sedimenti TaxID=2770274 RepID=A0A926KSL9_9BACL|nr:glycoside hydrolase family 88 protein [Paenibacillus sedimenti]MBD0381503.1 glycoside hydrolase family 88 protein [Paenibacillus sedimenti]